MPFWGFSFVAIFTSDTNGGYVLHFPHISRGNTTNSFEFFSSSGTHVLDHLAANGAGLTSLGDIDLIVVLHTKISPFAFFGRKHFPKKAFSVP